MSSISPAICDTKGNRWCRSLMSTLLTLVHRRNRCPIRISTWHFSSSEVSLGLESKKFVPWDFQNALLAHPHLHDTFVPAFIICQLERSRAAFMPSAICRTSDYFADPDSRRERTTSTFGWIKAVWHIQCWQLLSLRIPGWNSPFSAAVIRVIINKAGVMDSDFILFVWLITVTVL